MENIEHLRKPALEMLSSSDVTFWGQKAVAFGMEIS